MSDITREQAYRRWKKGGDQHDLAKEMGVTRERMRHILKKMDENVPLLDRIEKLEAERDEALNQLDSARHSVEVLEANVARKNCEIKKLWIALSTYETKVREYASDDWARSDHAYDWLNEDAGKTARAALAALKGENQ